MSIGILLARKRERGQSWDRTTAEKKQKKRPNVVKPANAGNDFVGVGKE